jgi:4-diphosphocytidyl-2-C-methyl-D-erythritol kinase
MQSAVEQGRSPFAQAAVKGRMRLRMHPGSGRNVQDPGSLSAKTGDSKPGTSGIVRDPNLEKKQGLPDENQADALNDLAENTLLELVRTGIGNHGLQNDFEEVVFPQYPSLRITKRQLMGSDLDGFAIYAALSGSGSALFGLYRSERDAKAAQQRVQSSGVQAFLTETLPRKEYWDRMFAG